MLHYLNLISQLAKHYGLWVIAGTMSFGHSMIIEPWGNILDRRRLQGAGIVFADIDLQRLQQLRQQFPCNEHHLLNMA